MQRYERDHHISMHLNMELRSCFFFSDVYRQNDKKRVHITTLIITTTMHLIYQSAVHHLTRGHNICDPI